MNAIQELFKNSASWTTVIFVVLVLLFAIKEIISVISYPVSYTHLTLPTTERV